MHFLMFVTIAMPDGSTSEDTRDQVYDDLTYDDSFCGSGGGRFSSPLCDWFVIGGRWSGILTDASINDRYRIALDARFPELTKAWYPADLAEKHRAELDAIWESCGGAGPSPDTRSSHKEFGYSDDAMPLTQQLYDAHLAKYRGEEIVRDHGCQYVDLDHEELDVDFVGRKWLVVIDYHC